MVLRILFLSILIASCAGNNGQGDKIRVESIAGDELFRYNCAACHGMDGNAGVGGASVLSESILTHHEIREVIKKGRNAMPPQTHAYNSDEELENLIEYVITLRNN